MAPIHHLQVGSLKDRWSLMHFLEVPGGLEVLHFKFQVSRMSGSPSRRPLSTISRLDPWRTDGSWRTSWRFLMAWRCYISNFRSLGCQEAHQEGPYPPSPGWILGGLGCFVQSQLTWHHNKIGLEKLPQNDPLNVHICPVYQKIQWYWFLSQLICTVTANLTSW